MLGLSIQLFLMSLGTSLVIIAPIAIMNALADYFES